MIELAEALLDDLLASVEGECEIARSAVTAGSPAAPNGECRALWVWIDQISDGAQFETGCVVRSALAVNYRFDVCYTESERGPTDAQHLAVAECLYGLVAAAWCGLVALKDSGLLMGLGDCDRAALAPLVVGSREGGYVSAGGSVIVDFDCVPVS